MTWRTAPPLIQMIRPSRPHLFTKPYHVYQLYTMNTQDNDSVIATEDLRPRKRTKHYGARRRPQPKSRANSKDHKTIASHRASSSKLETMLEQPTRRLLPYRYKSLDPSKKEIRVLELQAGTGDEPIRCSMKLISLLDEPYYETISYCWSQHPSLVGIFVDERSLLVPYSSAAVLCRLRRSRDVKTLWIDAVCIDQSNPDERGTQVAMMGDIYSISKRTWIELGDADRETARAGIRAVQLIMKDMMEKTNDLRSLDSIIFDKAGRRRYAKEGRGNDIDVDKLEVFLSSRWFRYRQPPLYP